MRCLIVDDSPRFVDAARGLLERQGITVVGVASTSAEALRRTGELRPDVTLVDIDLGGESGLELARLLHDRVSVMPDACDGWKPTIGGFSRLPGGPVSSRSSCG
jgi:DNA-binding NarL/FixJ family response regulator